MRLATALVCTLFVWTKSSVVSGEPAMPPTVSLEFDSSPGCGSKRGLSERLRRRIPRIRFAEDESATIQVRATVKAQHPGMVVGELVLTQSGIAQPPRVLEAGSCQDALEGMALILAITLDPTLDPVHRSSETASPSNDPSALTPAELPAEDASDGGEPSTSTRPRPERRAEDASSTEQTAQEPPPQVTLPRPHYSTFDETPAAQEPLHWGVGVAIAGNGVFGAAPSIMPGFAAYARVALERASVWSPAFVLGGGRVWSRDVAESSGTASFALDALTFDACALRLAFERLTARACGSLLLGSLSASGSNTRNSPGTVDLPFAAIGASAQLALSLSPPFEVSVRLAPRITLLRHEYEFGDDVFHTVAPVMLSASAGLGAYWD